MGGYGTVSVPFKEQSDSVRERHATGRWAVAGRKWLDWVYGHFAAKGNW